MRDFDEARKARLDTDRSFTIGGQEFTWRPSVAPESLLPWENRRDAVGQEFIDILDQTVLAFLEPGQEEKWQAARSPDAELPLNVEDIVDLIVWLFTAQTGNPTGPPADSSPTPGANGTASTDDSSPPATPAEPQPSTSASS